LSNLLRIIQLSAEQRVGGVVEWTLGTAVIDIFSSSATRREEA
jgi:hypothetical protein